MRRHSQSLRSIVVEVALVAAAVAVLFAFLNSDLPRAIGEEIGRNLLSR
jgi:hypothetical protein